MSNETKSSVKTLVNFLAEPYYKRGLELLVKKQHTEGRTSASQTSVIKEGLEKLFKEYEITREAIAEALNVEEP